MAIAEGGISEKILKHMKANPVAWRAGPLAKAIRSEASRVSNYLGSLFKQDYLVRCEVSAPGKKRTEWEYRIAMGKPAEIRPLKSSHFGRRLQETHGATVTAHELPASTQINVASADPPKNLTYEQARKAVEAAPYAAEPPKNLTYEHARKAVEAAPYAAEPEAPFMVMAGLQGDQPACAATGHPAADELCFPLAGDFSCSLDSDGFFSIFGSDDSMVELDPADYQKMLAYIRKVEGLGPINFRLDN